MTSSPEITFRSDGLVSLDLNKGVSGALAVCQNALVNLLEIQGRDALFPLRGVDLLDRALSGAILDRRTADHAGNFAASDTLFFGRQWEVADTPDKLDKVFLSATISSASTLRVECTFVTIDGRVFSFPITSNITEEA